MTARTTLHLTIHGRVQGVFFRESMVHKATSLGVTGWVKNQVDGTVEAVVQGEAAAIDAIVEWARHGPPSARVDRVDRVNAEDAEGAFATFEKRVSA